MTHPPGKFYYEYDLDQATQPAPPRMFKEGDVLAMTIDVENADAYTFKNPMTLAGQLASGRGSFIVRVSSDVTDDELADMVRQIQTARALAT